ncbi:hypothetical protein GCM10027449_14370 [Sinomonas notoginsengisoli]|uniref:hypothetical protein n=1 Tax=Sinomonas notoginsengisoli TaxID=1457311 RepID=UPI001F45D297|nr:hypothetical protein [Sinomonas notoginsengisoli]
MVTTKGSWVTAIMKTRAGRSGALRAHAAARSKPVLLPLGAGVVFRLPVWMVDAVAMVHSNVSVPPVLVRAALP